MLHKYTVKSITVLRLTSQLMIMKSKWPQVPPGEWIALLQQTISCLYGLNFDCATTSDTFNYQYQ